MKIENRVRGMLAKKLETPEFSKRFQEGYEAFELEVQILNTLEAKGWSYSKLAEATQTSKSNVSRDLNGGGLLSATLSRIRRMADALGMRLVMLLIPKDQAQFIIPKLEDIARSSFNAAHGGFPVEPLTVSSPYRAGTVNAALYFTTAQTGIGTPVRLNAIEGADR